MFLDAPRNLLLINIDGGYDNHKFIQQVHPRNILVAAYNSKNRHENYFQSTYLKSFKRHT